MRSHAKAASVLVSVAILLGIVASAASAAPSAHPGWGLQGSSRLDPEGPYETPRSPLSFGPDGLVGIDGHATSTLLYEPVPPAGLKAIANFAAPIPRNVAVDPGTGDIYVDQVAVFGGTTVRRFTPDGNSPPAYSEAAGFEVPQGDDIAVDPSTHDLLVADAGAEGVRRYDTTGKLVETISTPGINPSWLLAMADGSFYVASAAGPDLYHLSGSGVLLGTIAGVGSINGLGYDAVHDLIVVAVGAELVGYSPLGARIAESPAASDQTDGIALSPTGVLYENSGLQPVNINIYLPGTVPGVEAPTPVEVTATAAKFEVEVDPGEEGGSPPAGSAVRFEARLVGTTAWTASPDQPVAAAGTYTGEISGLNSNAEYEVRAVASNAVITNPGSPVTFTTPPGPPRITTDPVKQLNESSAVIEGLINPFGLSTSFYVEYGTSPLYGSRIPLEGDSTAGAGVTDRPISKTLLGLSPGTTYHYRVVASNSAGTAQSADATFTTPSAGSIPVRAYEQVTPADKQGANVVAKLGMHAAVDGSGITYSTLSGSESSPLISRSVALRESEDWSRKIDTDPAWTVTGQAIQVRGTLAISRDFEHTFVVSNRALTPGGIAEGGANLYKVDIRSNTYHLIGSSNAPNAFYAFSGTTTGGRFQAGSSNFSWIMFQSTPPLLPGAPPDALYRWSEGDGLELLSILPSGEGISAMRANTQVYHTVSADGSRVYYSSVKPEAPGEERVIEAIYLRENGGAPTPISVPHISGEPATPKPAVLLGTNEDGRYAFFVSRTQLTPDAPPTQAGGYQEPVPLYRYDASDGSLEYLGAEARLYVAADYLQVSEGAGGISSDGDTIYFARPNGSLSVWHDGVVHSLGQGGGQQMSPNGRYFAFNAPPKGVVELYDAETEELQCASCTVTGLEATGGLAAEGQGDILLGNLLAHSVLDDGSVIFDTLAPLVAKDVNGARDVYIYRGGQANLISPGTRPFDAVYADASLDGKNVFFTTAQKLVGRDNDESVDIYDARIDGGLAAQNPPPPQVCIRDDCKATPRPGPELPFGGSEALAGPANLHPVKKKATCGRGKRKIKHKGKAKCVKKHRARTSKKGVNK